jgi:hypothetical protein
MASTYYPILDYAFSVTDSGCAVLSLTRKKGTKTQTTKFTVASFRMKIKANKNLGRDQSQEEGILNEFQEYQKEHNAR